MNGPLVDGMFPYGLDMGIVNAANMEIFQDLTQLSFKGKVREFGPGEAIKWDDYQHTPQIWVDNLRSMPIWERDTWHRIDAFMQTNLAHAVQCAQTHHCQSKS